MHNRGKKVLDMKMEKRKFNYENMKKNKGGILSERQKPAYRLEEKCL